MRLCPAPCSPWDIYDQKLKQLMQSPLKIWNSCINHSTAPLPNPASFLVLGTGDFLQHRKWCGNRKMEVSNLAGLFLIWLWLCSLYSLSQIIIFNLEPQLSVFIQHWESLTQIHTFFFSWKCSKPRGCDTWVMNRVQDWQLDLMILKVFFSFNDS